MKKLGSISAVISAAVLSGCAGQLYVHTDKNTACASENGECSKLKGVPFYPLKAVTQHYLYDRVLDAKGNIVLYYGKTKAEERCRAFIKEETSLVPDLETPYVAEYDAAWFETVAFSVSLSEKGTLSSVGATSTPGGKALVDSVIATTNTVRELSHGFTTAGFVGGEPTPDITIPLCNAGKVPVAADFMKTKENSE